MHKKKISYKQNDNWEQIVSPGPRSKNKILFIEKQINRINKGQLRKLRTLNNIEEKPPVKFNKIFAFKQNQWVHLGYRCQSCDSTMSDPLVLEKHKNLCSRINTISIDKKVEEFVPIQRVMKNNQPYYRYGTHGKLYKTIKEAEAQAVAIHASGYKEPINKQNK